MTCTLQRALTIGCDDMRVSVGVICFEPTQQSGTKVETDVGVVVDNSLSTL